MPPPPNDIPASGAGRLPPEAPIPDPGPPRPDSPERRALEASPSTRCLNCGEDLPGTYCPTCGQKDQPLRQPVRRFVLEAFGEYFGLDGRVWPTMRALLFRPGRLTQAYVLGRRQQYVRPLRIYITASVTFFFLLALIDPLGQLRRSMTREALALSDTTMTAGAYAATLDSLLAGEGEAERRQRLLVDSIVVDLETAEAAFQADSVQGRLSDLDSLDVATDALDDVREDLEDEQDELASMKTSTEERRLLWQREVVRGFPPG